MIEFVYYFKLSVDLMMKFQSGYADGEETATTTASTYLDPLTKTTYTWNSTEHQWKPLKMQYNYPDNYKYTDPRTGHLYVWKAKEQKWQTVENQANETDQVSGKKEAEELDKDNSQTSTEATTPSNDENSSKQQGIVATIVSF